MILLIMAAGMGSRFGGLKQIEPVGPNGEFIIDYSIYDAIKAGFDKVVFIIKEENYEIFKSTIGNRIEGKIKVEYVFQKNDNVPDDVDLPSDRVKPLGTGHAILCSKDVVNEPFLVINSDDFYGRDAYMVAANYIRNNHDENRYALVGYNVENTLSENGAVKRGICSVDDNKYLTNLVESSVEMVDGDIVAQPLDGRPSFKVDSKARASMNMFIFYPNLFDYLENDFYEFLHGMKDQMKDEFLIPDVVFKHLNKNDITEEVLDTTSVWKGITYPTDLAALKEYIQNEIEREVYPLDLN